MLQRFISMADEQAKWEAEEKERQAIERVGVGQQGAK